MVTTWIGVMALWVWTTWMATAAALSSSDYFVHSLPGQPEGPLLKMHAGHIEVDAASNGHLFFWLNHNRHIANKQRLVIWLNGGPGCSSEDGALMEVGPYRLQDDHTLKYNDGSWDEFATLLFVDQPVGTGFSYVNGDSYLHELDQMKNHMIIFLEKFFEMFPEYEHDDIYISGESYAGQHIPYIAKGILDRNVNAKHKWNLKGLLIGNGWISPRDQYLSYLPFAYKNGLIQGGTAAARELEMLQAQCLAAVQGTVNIDMPECERILTDILRLSQDYRNPQQSCVNMYDVRLRDSHPSCGMNWPPDLTSVTPYLRRPDVVKALHINPDKRSGWQECNGNVGRAFQAKNSKPSIDILPELLKTLPIVLFSGDKDLICNHLGTEELIHNMNWNGGKGFEVTPGVWAPRRQWTFEGEPAGFYQEARNLTYIVFYNSSHMVPFDYSRRSRDMLDRFLGVDIGSIGGKPSNSRIDGEKGLETSVGGHPNSTVAEEAEKEKLQKATWDAYYKSGGIALVFVSIAAVAWGIFIWRSRRATQGYAAGIRENGHSQEASWRFGARRGLEAFRAKRTANRNDVEAADFDESELDNLNPTPDREDMEAERYSLGEGSSDEDRDTEKPRK